MVLLLQMASIGLMLQHYLNVTF